MELTLTRPLAFFDLESTDNDPATARITQVSIMVLHPDGNLVKYYRTFNPLVPLTPGAAAVTRLTDEYLATCPPLSDHVAEIVALLEGCDLAGQNIKKFDIPLLAEELFRNGINWPQPGTLIADTLLVDAQLRPRKLAALYNHYTGKVMDGDQAHDAEYDTDCTRELLLAMVEQHGQQTGATVEELHRFTKCHEMVDYYGKFKRGEDGTVLYAFGKHNGKPVTICRDYASWIYKGTFPQPVKEILRAEFQAKKDREQAARQEALAIAAQTSENPI